jgi:hypothetical protein
VGGRQVLLALLPRGQERRGVEGTPLTEIVRAFRWISIPLLLKSGKFGTPLARTHFEKASVEPVE